MTRLPAAFPLSAIQWHEPEYLWLLIAPAAMLLLWVRYALQRRTDVRRLESERRAPIRERFALVGPLWPWLAFVLALTLTIIALARPTAPVALVRSAGVDIIVLQDGSASMHVPDVEPDRWQRSMRFLRVLAEGMQWTDDRLGFAVFAHIAAPQVRLTRDPNTVFFFLEHLASTSPFLLQEDSTWDTNIETGLHWGMRLIDKDEQLLGRSPNAKAFVLVSDGQAWSGSIRTALAATRAREIPVFVVGVGTAAGGRIPPGPPPPSRSSVPSPPPPPVFSRLDRASLLAIASEARGQYFELGREPDRTIAAAIIGATRKHAGLRGVQTSNQELYWQFLLAAGLLLAVAAATVRDRAELWLQTPILLLAVVVLWILAR